MKNDGTMDVVLRDWLLKLLRWIIICTWHRGACMHDGFKCMCCLQFFTSPWSQSVILQHKHYGDVIMGAMASQITSLTIVNSTDYSGADQSKHQSFASLAFVRGIHWSPGNSPHKWSVTRKLFPFDDVIMSQPGTGGELLKLCSLISPSLFGRLSVSRKYIRFFESHSYLTGATRAQLWRHLSNRILNR